MLKQKHTVELLSRAMRIVYELMTYQVIESSQWSHNYSLYSIIQPLLFTELFSSNVTLLLDFM